MSSVCHAVQVKLMVVPIASLLDDGVEEILILGSAEGKYIRRLT